jgi:hypothetical protein
MGAILNSKTHASRALLIVGPFAGHFKQSIKEFSHFSLFFAVLNDADLTKEPRRGQVHRARFKSVKRPQLRGIAFNFILSV